MSYSDVAVANNERDRGGPKLGADVRRAGSAGYHHDIVVEGA